MYDNYLFVLIYGLFVCMYVRVQARSVSIDLCMSFLLCMQTKILHIHIMFPPPPVGGLGGSYHLQPCIGITICFY